MVEPTPATFPDLIRQARRHGDRVFLPRRQAQNEEPITFARLADDVDALSAAYAIQGGYELATFDRRLARHPGLAIYEPELG